MFSQDRSKQREFLASSWQKHINGEILEPLELQLALIVQKHPEYHALINDINLEYFPEQGKTNPFLHINLHLALQDQLTLNQPTGINDIYKKLVVISVVYFQPSDDDGYSFFQCAYLSHIKRLF